MLLQKQPSGAKTVNIRPLVAKPARTRPSESQAQLAHLYTSGARRQSGAGTALEPRQTGSPAVTVEPEWHGGSMYSRAHANWLTVLLREEHTVIYP